MATPTALDEILRAVGLSAGQLLPADLYVASARGWRVFPCTPRAKAPLIREWQRLATTAPEQALEAWLARHPSGCSAMTAGAATPRVDAREILTEMQRALRLDRRERIQLAATLAAWLNKRRAGGVQ